MCYTVFSRGNKTVWDEVSGVRVPHGTLQANPFSGINQKFVCHTVLLKSSNAV
jgi:hypothetical protein